MKKPCLLILCGLLILAIAGCESAQRAGNTTGDIGGWLRNLGDAVNKGADVVKTAPIPKQ